MKFLEIKQLNEVHVLGDVQDGHYVVAYRENIWVFADDDWEEHVGDIAEKVEIDAEVYEDDFWEFQRYVSEEGPDIILGQIEGEYLHMNTFNYRHSSASSTLRKVLSALRLKGVEVLSSTGYEENSTSVSFEEFTKDLKDKEFFHGTSVGAMWKMLKTGGIRPQSDSNFKNIVHDNKIFVTLNKEKAHFHAMTAARNHGDFPVIIEVKIPDVNKLVDDYDVAIELLGKDHERSVRLGYSDIAYRTNSEASQDDVQDRQSDGAEDINTKLGIFGYLGRIPHTFIMSVHVPDERFEEYVSNKVHDWDEEFDVGHEEFQSLQDWEEWDLMDFKEHYEETRDEIEGEMDEDDEDW